MITKEYLQQELRRRIEGIKPGVETTTDNIIAEMKSILVLVDAINDYEKKYNEALERARQIKDGKDEWRYSDLAEITPALTEIFPELRESEDEKTRKELLNFVKSFWADHKEKLPQTSRWVTYLEKQKEQKSAEWSEEDERMLSRCIKSVECSKQFSDTSTFKDAKDKEISWLKSLRPSWKPSNEQMEALFSVLEHEAEREGPSKALEIANLFYDNLKKLM